jgi:cytochrome c biogenesis protein CcmG/thiol:disulfide interchange protein DsbE
MTESTNNAPQRKGVPLWAQIIVWLALAGLLFMLALGLWRAQRPMAEIGKTAPEMYFEFYKGYEYQGQTTLNLSDLRGKVVIINVWASWCKPCEQEAPDLQAFWQEYQDRDVVLIGVDYVDTPAGAFSYLKKFKITFPNAPDLQSAISSALNRKMGVPETYFIDREGVLQYVQIGPFTSVSEIQKILAEKIDPAFAE